MIELTPKQQHARDKALKFAHSGGDVFMMSGLAGTGKTTTLVEIVQALQQEGFKPAVCTPTGKAAFVINSKQNVFAASTLHKTLTVRPLDFTEPIHKRLDALEAMGDNLTPAEQEEERDLLKQLDDAKRNGNSLSFIPKEPEEFLAEYNMLVFDEASMIGARTYEDLIARIPCPKIFVGDKAQLPPVKDQPAVNLARADVHLDEILRQGADSGILKYAHSVHAGRVMTAANAGKYPDLSVLPDHDHRFLRSHLRAGQQVVVHTNKERHAFNELLRPLNGFEAKDHMPLIGEKIMVQENDDALRLLRGELLEIEDIQFYEPKLEPYQARVKVIDRHGYDRSIQISLSDLCQKQLISNPDKDKKARFLADRRNLMVRYPYAVTAHTAQGSEWDDVLVVGSMMPDTWKEWKSWWYTACTRAKSNLTIASYHYTLNP
jgi:exodeoxyribonuclease-5